MKAILTLEELRALVKTGIQKESLPCSLVHSGIPRGAITEVFGSGKTEFVLKFLSEHPEIKVAWVEQNFSAYPFAFLQRKVDLNRVLFVDAGEKTDWAILQVLRAQIFSAVVVYAELIDLKILRRIQIAAEKAQIAVIWLSNKPQGGWTNSLQVKVRKSRNELQVDILKQRF